MNNDNNCARIFVTFIIAMCLRIAPLPESLALLNPDWVLLVLIYWSLAIPERVGIGHAWILGILVDVLMGRLFGQYALSYSLIIYMVLIWHRQLRQFPLIQQSAFVFGCLLISQLLLFWFENIKAPAQLHVTFWLPVLSGTVSWFIVYYVMRFIRRF
ncbi:MAG: rod shape-determining protein MreD [Methylococcaceae bacterium]|nr:rod shape-determining protein MreD [Methylococcaceae bacterium]